MHPVLIHLGGVAVHTWGVTAAVGFLWFAGAGLWRARQRGVAPERAADALLAGAVAGLIGARVLARWTAVGGLPATQPWDWIDWIDPRSGGASFFGAALLALPTATLVGRLRGVPLAITWDAFAAGAPLGFAVARLGCLAAGCCYGEPTELPWGVALPGLPEAVHPTPVYEAAWQGVLAIGLPALWARRRRVDGVVFWMWVGGTGLGRLVVEALRGDPGRGQIGPWSVPTVLSLGAIALTAWAFRHLHRDADPDAPR